MTHHPTNGPASALDVAAARRFATKAHHGQTRKITGEAYVTHPIAVAEWVQDHGGDTAQVIAALLHDAVEDTPVSLVLVEREFGPDVAHLVEAVTKRDGETYFDFVRRSIDAGPRVWLVKRADVLHNWSSLPPECPLNKRYAKTIAMLDEAEKEQ